jgi:hypothetical protein
VGYATQLRLLKMDTASAILRWAIAIPAALVGSDFCGMLLGFVTFGGSPSRRKDFKKGCADAWRKRALGAGAEDNAFVTR